MLILTTFDLDEYVVDALQAGASGFLLKDAPPEELVHAVRVVAPGRRAAGAGRRPAGCSTASRRALTRSQAPAADASAELTDRELRGAAPGRAAG